MAGLYERAVYLNPLLHLLLSKKADTDPFCLNVDLLVFSYEQSLSYIIW